MYTQPCYARGALVYLISDGTNGIGGCAPRREIESAEWKQKKKRRKSNREKRKDKKARKTCTIAFDGAKFTLATVPRHRLFVCIRSSISIYNTPSPHAAAVVAAVTVVVAAVGRKSYRAENGFSWEMWRARVYGHNTTHRQFDDIAKLECQVNLTGRVRD